ncbi:g540 [Coccomyxa viridis]|uniref:G540 protein n=1 Tax=Coccomyxa viridis TaxID=1274662 RepID=A0ABP1FL98_9CHLO
MRREGLQQHFAAILACLCFGVLLRTILLPGKQSPCGKVTVLVLPDAHASSFPGLHNLETISDALIKKGIGVTIARDPEFVKGFGEDSAWQELQEYDAVLAQGVAAQWVADAAAEAGVPLVRFPGPGVNGAQDYIDPLMEHPDVIVESQWKSLGAPRPQHYLDAQILHLAPDASLSAHDELATVIKSLCKGGVEWPMRLQVREAASVNLLGLTVLAKNEAHRIAPTLTMMRDYVDYWAVLVTNTSDNTSAVVHSIMKPVPGQVVEEKLFTDFASARNKVFQAIGNRTRLVVMLDADFEIWHAWRLRRFAQRLALFCDVQPRDARCYHSFKLPAILASFRFYRTAVFTTHDLGRETGWHYVYPVHEVPISTNPILPTPGESGLLLESVQIRITIDPEPRNVKRAMELDIHLLAKERRDKPDDTRVAFYYAQVLETIGMMREAVEAYKVRVQLGGWKEEAFEAQMRVGRILHNALEEDAVSELLQAHRMSPWRAEPLVYLAWQYARRMQACLDDLNSKGNARDPACVMRNRIAAYLYSKEATEKPIPSDIMFVDTQHYTFYSWQALEHHARLLTDQVLGIGTRAIYSVGRLQVFARSNESRRYQLGGLKQLERDWVQHQRQIDKNNIIWGWPQRWFRRVSRPA